MSRVWIPQVLRAAAGGVKQLELEGSTVGDLVRALAAAHPSVGAQLFTPEGDLNRFVNVYVNGQDVRYLDGLATPVGAHDEVRLLPAMAGGCNATAGSGGVLARIDAVCNSPAMLHVIGLGCCVCTGRVPDGFYACAPQRRGAAKA